MAGEDPFGLEQPPPFEPGERDEDSPASAAELEHGLDYEPPPPELIEWTPERAGAVVRGVGFALHAADPLADEEGGAELWRATTTDCDDIGPPLARILNRYEPSRRLAGVSDEAEFAFGMLAYAKRNLALRGRLVTAQKEAAHPATGEPPNVVWPMRPGDDEPEATLE